MPDYIALYRAYLEQEKHASPNTVSSYVRDLTQFRAWLPQGSDLRRVKPAAVEEDMLVTLEVFYEYYLRGFQMAKMDLYRSDATRFIVDQENNALIPPFTACPGLGESAALSIVEARKGREFISIEEFAMCCNKLSKTHIEQLKALGAFAGMADTSQITLF